MTIPTGTRVTPAPDFPMVGLSPQPVGTVITPNDEVAERAAAAWGWGHRNVRVRWDDGNYGYHPPEELAELSDPPP